MDLDQIQKHQLKQACKDFKALIKTDDVCALASLHNGHKPCHIFAEPRSGSYNVCFFVEFPASDDEQTPLQRWTARFPMPTVHDPIQKLKSEVATIKCVDLSAPIQRSLDHR